MVELNDRELGLVTGGGDAKPPAQTKPANPPPKKPPQEPPKPRPPDPGVDWYVFGEVAGRIDTNGKNGAVVGIIGIGGTF